MKKPSVFNMIQVTTIRLSQLVASSTARWFLDTIRMIRAIAAATTATIVEMPNNWVYMSFITFVNVVHILPDGAAKTVCMERKSAIAAVVMVQ